MVELKKKKVRCWKDGVMEEQRVTKVRGLDILR